MSTTTRDLPESAAAAVNEAARIATEAARNGTESAKASVGAARSYLDETNSLGRDLFSTLNVQNEAAIKAAFDAQNAAVEAGLGLFDLGVKGNRQAIEQFSELMRRTQQVTLETWQATVKATHKATDAPRR
ncbi:MAG: hypothetical protein ABI628_02800 [Chloroflexota bacterium]